MINEEEEKDENNYNHENYENPENVNAKMAPNEEYYNRPVSCDWTGNYNQNANGGGCEFMGPVYGREDTRIEIWDRIHDKN